PGTKVSLAFLGSDGKVIRELKGEVEAEAAKPTELKGGAPPPPPPAPTEAIKSEGSAAERPPTAEAGAEAAGHEEEAGGAGGPESERLTGITNGDNRVSWDFGGSECE